MVNHITKQEMEDLDMLMFLQRIAGIQTSYEIALEGWRSLSEPAREHIRIAAAATTLLKTGYKPIGGRHDAPATKAFGRA